MLFFLRLCALPNTIGDIRSLRALSLSHNQLQQLPDSFTQLLSLQCLYLNHNHLQTLNPEVHQLQQLSVLQVHHNKLETLPQGLSKLEGLRELTIGSNLLQQLPDGLLAALGRLEVLDLGRNKLQLVGLMLERARDGVDAQQWQQQPESIGTTRSSAAEDQLLRDCPEDIAAGTSNAAAAGVGRGATGGFTAHSAAGASTAAAGILPCLRYLDISHNHPMQQLPSWLPPSLTHIKAAGLGIRYLPPEFCFTHSNCLVHLDLQENQLTMMPNELTQLSKLELLALASNPAVHPEECAACHEEYDATAITGSDDKAVALAGGWPGLWMLAKRSGKPWPPPRIRGGSSRTPRTPRSPPSRRLMSARSIVY